MRWLDPLAVATEPGGSVQVTEHADGRTVRLTVLDTTDGVPRLLLDLTTEQAAALRADLTWTAVDSCDWCEHKHASNEACRRCAAAGGFCEPCERCKGEGVIAVYLGRDGDPLEKTCPRCNGGTRA